MWRKPDYVLPGMPIYLSCPACEMELRHERECPYEELSMVDAWVQYRLKQQKASSQEQAADVAASNPPI